MRLGRTDGGVELLALLEIEVRVERVDLVRGRVGVKVGVRVRG